MKILFFFALLANIIFFLWEFNSGAFNFQQGKKTIENNAKKQILLLSELAEIDQGKSLIVSVNNRDFKHQITTSELKISTDIKSDSKAKAKAKNNIKIQSSDLTIVVKVDDNVLVKKTQKKLLANRDEKQSIAKENKSIKATHLADIKKSTDKSDKGLTQTIEKKTIKTSSINKNNLNEKQSELLKNYCYDIGPFRDQGELDVWRKLNDLKAISFRQSNIEREIVSGYLVYYPAAENYEDSRGNVQLLKEKGVTDVWLFREGELKGTISMGLFRNKKGAMSLHEKLVNMGLDVKIMPRYKTESDLYLQMLTQDLTLKNTIVFTEKQELSRCQK